MPVLSGVTAEAELSLVTAVGGLDAGSTPYPYTALSPDDFERLNYALFNVSSPVGHERLWDEAAIMVRGADAGRDILLLRQKTLAGVVQCKRLESAMALPAVFREIAKMVLFAHVDPSLPKITANLSYYLALAHEAAGTVVDFFARPLDLLQSRAADIEGAVREVIESYKGLAGLSEADAIAEVQMVLPTLHYKLLRPMDLDAWLGTQVGVGVATRFFRHRVLVDSAPVEAQLSKLSDLLAGMGQRMEGVPLLTDVDLKIIKSRIEDTPETHRLTVGFASLFGFPREMFVGDENLRRRVGRLATVVSELNADYTNWLFAQASDEAQHICDLGEVVWRVHPFARQIPNAFLGLVARDVAERALSGEVLGRILSKLSSTPQFETDEARLAHIRAVLLEAGAFYLKEDYSQVLGDEGQKRLKIRIIQQMMKGLADEGAVKMAFDQGLEILRPHLIASATRLRTLGAHKTSVFILGVTGIDDPAVVAQLSATVRALEAMKGNPAGPAQ